MQTRVVFFPGLGEAQEPPSSLFPTYSADIFESLHQEASIVLVSERKFIVLRSPDSVVIVIGPIVDGNSYYHKNLLATFYAQEVHSDLQISGGGLFTLTDQYDLGSRKRYRKVKFSGSSGSYGAYDPIILERSVATSIARALGNTISFDWQSSASP